MTASLSIVSVHLVKLLSCFLDIGARNRVKCFLLVFWYLRQQIAAFSINLVQCASSEGIFIVFWKKNFSVVDLR